MSNFSNRLQLEAPPVPVGLARKRIVDIVLALSGLILFSPLYVLCCFLIALSSPGPVLFRHRRVGFKGRQFDCLKFRTMVRNAPERPRPLLANDPNAAGEWTSCRKLRNDPRVTFVGSILRKSGLDELPQLFNVLKGEMSIVGPRPASDADLVRYAGSAARAYLACRPGITGLSQVNGRSGTRTEDERIACQSFYVGNWSMALDAKILLATIPSLFSDRGY